MRKNHRRFFFDKYKKSFFLFPLQKQKNDDTLKIEKSFHQNQEGVTANEYNI